MRKLRKAFPLRNKKYTFKEEQEVKKTEDTEETNSYNSESDEDLDMFRVVQNAKRNKKKLHEVKLPELNLDKWA